MEVSNKGSYLIRFDDICPEMNWAVWEKIESILDKNNVRPVLAVVPDNQDPHLKVNNPRQDFWDRVRAWQAKGWTIGLHGFQHLYVTNDPGLVGLNARSEFAGLSHEVQREKINKALEIFRSQKIRPEVWIAPGHSFDKTTVNVLLENGIKTISDGYFFRPVLHLGATWVPQQLWRFRKTKSGVWTVCYHHNNWSDAQLVDLENNIHNYRSQIVSLTDVIKQSNIVSIQWSDRGFQWIWRFSLLMKRTVKQIITRASRLFK